METNIIGKDSVNLVINALKNGEVVAFKTDTIFGFSCLASNRRACAKLQELKKRENKPFIILLGKDMDINRYVKNISIQAKKIMDSFWPGPLTIIFESGYDFCKEITCGKNTIGIRIPDHELTQSIINGVGEPIVSTSVNISGKSFLNNELDILKAFSGKIPYIVKDSSSGNSSSTIISGLNGEINILREGCIKKDEIINFLKNI